MSAGAIVGIDYAEGYALGRNLSADEARVERARLKKWRSPGRKRG